MLFVSSGDQDWRNLRRVKVVKNKVYSGKSMVCIEHFLMIKYVGMCVKISRKESMAACMLKYACGSVLRRFMLCAVDLRKPVSFGVPWFYMSMKRC